jgi:hypothetical protein
VTVIVWPSTLPQRFNRPNFRRSYGDGRLRSGTDTGSGKVRRRSSAVPSPFAAELILTTSQQIRLETFWDADTGGGSLPFALPAPGLHGWPLAAADGTPITTEDGTPIVISCWWVAMFDPTAGPPTVAPLSSTEWSATLSLWRMP